MKVTAELDNLYALLEAVRIFAKKQGVDSKKIHQLELAVEEIVVNIIHYAYPPGTSGDIEIHCGFEEEKKLLIEIIDRGIPLLLKRTHLIMMHTYPPSCPILKR